LPRPRPPRPLAPKKDRFGIWRRIPVIDAETTPMAATGAGTIDVSPAWLSYPLVIIGPMTATEIDLLIAAYARRQYGVFNRDQARRAGASDSFIERRRAGRSWITVDPAVFALPSHPATWQQRCMASVLAEPRAVLSGRTAAALHGFEGFRPGHIEITVPPGSNHRSRLARVRESALVTHTRLGPLPVTTVPQTVIDIARHLDAGELGRLVDAQSLARPSLLAGLQDRYARLARSRLPGSGRVRDVLEQRGDGYVPPASELEARLIDVLGLLPDPPVMVRQAALPWRPAAADRVDVAIPAWRVIVEGDGRRWHTRVADFERDRRRDNDAVVHGWRPVRFTWFNLTHEVGDVLDTMLGLRALAESARAA
jgi:hypothetical protein